MGTLLEFPSKQARGLAFLERQLSDLLRARGANQRLVDFATGQLTEIYGRINASEQYQFQVHLPDGLSDAQQDALRDEITAGLEHIRKENHSLALELAAGLLLAKVQLFQRERSD